MQISIPKVSLGDTSVLGGAVPVESMPTIFPGHAPQPLTPSPLEPEYVQGTNRLSPQGKMQVLSIVSSPSLLKLLPFVK